jgi:hypothetical protein
VLQKIAYALGFDVDHLLAAGGRFSMKVERYMKRNPYVGVLFRCMAEKDLREDDIQNLVKQVGKLGKYKQKEKS